MQPIRCIECYKQRPGGRCEFCPLHKKNRSHYRHIGDGWYIRVEQEEKKMKEIKVYDFKTVFGWETDNGLGERLIQQILRGEKWATCAPKESYTEQELAEVYQSVGKIVTVFDKHNRPRCNIKMNDVFETTFGNPDPRLVRGEGNGDNVQEFQDNHRKAWHEDIENGFDLNDHTILIVELFELVVD